MTRQLQYSVFKTMVVAKSLRDTPDRSVCSISAAIWGPFEKAQEMTGPHCGFLASSNPSHGRDLGWQKETGRLPEAMIILEVTTTGKQIQVLELWNLETRQRRPKHNLFDDFTSWSLFVYPTRPDDTLGSPLLNGSCYCCFPKGSITWIYRHMCGRYLWPFPMQYVSRQALPLNVFTYKCHSTTLPTG